MDVTRLIVIIIRSIVAVSTLFLLTKIMGRKQISQLSIFDYVIGISIGSIAAQMTIDTEIEWIDFVFAMAIFGLIDTLIAILTLKSIWARRFFEGDPVIIIQDGKIIEKNLKKIKFTVNEFLQECRIGGYYNIDDISMAIMESSGKISFLPKVEKRPVNVEDMDIAAKPEGLVANVIIDGNIMKNNLKIIGKNEVWLMKQLNMQDISSPKEILLATCDVNSTIRVFKKDEKIKEKKCLR